MKFWLKNLAILFVIGCGVCPAQGEKGSMAEFLPPDREDDRPFRIPFKLDSNKRSSTAVNARADLQPTVMSEYRNSSSTPCIVEFGAAAQPVSAQPPTIRPSAQSPRIQEFSTIPLAAFEPLPQEKRTFVKAKLQRKSHKLSHQISHHSSRQIAQLGPHALSQQSAPQLSQQIVQQKFLRITSLHDPLDLQSPNLRAPKPEHVKVAGKYTPGEL